MEYDRKCVQTVREKGIFADHPLSPWQRMLQEVVGGFYNHYYLTELEDGSWLCVYFDDYASGLSAIYKPLLQSFRKGLRFPYCI